MAGTGWVIAVGEVSAELHVGDVITFGRSRTCDITLAEDDTLISRHAGTVIVGRDHVEVLNTSSANRLVLVPNVGPHVDVRPDGSATSRGMPVFSIVLMGRRNTEYVIEVHGPGSPPTVLFPLDEGEPEVSTVVRPFDLTAAEAAIVQAMCGPLLRARGRAAVPGTYQQVAKQLSLAPGTVRNRIKGIRDRAAEFGIPGLGGEDEPLADDYRGPLCEFAIANGWAFGEV